MQWHQERGTLEPGRTGNAYNCLELFAATLAVRSFLKDHTVVSVLLQFDIQMAVAYINNLGWGWGGGTVSPLLTQLAKELWMWALSKNIILVAEHIPGITNCMADAESRTWTNRMDWSQHPRVIQKDNSSVGSVGGGPICILSVQSTATILQLETGPVSGSHRRFQQQ